MENIIRCAQGSLPPSFSIKLDEITQSNDTSKSTNTVLNSIPDEQRDEVCEDNGSSEKKNKHFM